FLLVVGIRFSPVLAGLPPCGLCCFLFILVSSLVCFVRFSGFLYKKDQFEPPVTAENWSLGSLLFGLIF
ncbi:hypothetical protein, partial [Streptomyces fungicidicus]|uniref:hypothetical protein n=1 Tax=Streptomyces fungicidicus TaxID=68203 RepID=UPI0033DDA7BE